MFGLLISLAALIVAVFSVRKTGMRFFKVTMAIVIIGVFFVNDGLRMWNPLEMPINMKLSLYGISFFVVIGCAFCANALARSKKQS